jgi:hypothetical protein
MTRSIFDPTGGETEHSGSRNMGPAAGNLSHMPPDVIDGEVPTDEMLNIETGDDISQGTTVPGLPPDTTQPESSDVERPNPGQAVE